MRNTESNKTEQTYPCVKTYWTAVVALQINGGKGEPFRRWCWGQLVIQVAKDKIRSCLMPYTKVNLSVFWVLQKRLSWVLWLGISMWLFRCHVCDWQRWWPEVDSSRMCHSPYWQVGIHELILQRGYMGSSWSVLTPGVWVFPRASSQKEAAVPYDLAWEAIVHFHYVLLVTQIPDVIWKADAESINTRGRRSWGASCSWQPQKTYTCISRKEKERTFSSSFDDAIRRKEIIGQSHL